MKFIIVLTILFTILALRFFFFYQSVPVYQNGQEINLQVVLQEEPVISNRGQRFSVKNSQNQRIYIISSLNTLYHYGDRLAMSGKLQVRKNEKGVIFYNLNYPKTTVLPSSKNPLTEASTFVRQRSLRLFEEVLPPVSSNLMMGIVFGAKGDFPDNFFQSLRNSGVLHVIAASGMNVSFFTGAIMFSLGTFLKRQIAIILSIFAVIFYSFLVGFEASIIRASIMALITFTASFFGRQILALFALFLTGFLMLLWSPAFLFDVGFQLSFMATMGILLIGERLGTPLRPDFAKATTGKQGFAGQALGRLGGLGEDFKTTVSAQIATFPILLGTFGSVGLLSLLVNLLVLWTVPILMLLGSLGVLGGLVFAPFGKLFLLFSLPFLIYFEQVVSFFGSFGWNFKMENFPWQFSIGYYLILGAILLLLRNKMSKY